jgi:hypothetical protein
MNMSKLPINLDAITRTLCVFANDFENLGGGYLVIGQDCDANGQSVFPPVHHVLVDYLEAIWEPKFIFDSYACRKQKMVAPPGCT